MFLHPHPDRLPSQPFALEARVRAGPDVLHLRYHLTGPIGLLEIPAPGAGERTDGLWEHLCFEAFVRSRGASDYLEMNFSPSGDWAAYRFTGRRAGMANALEAPSITVEVKEQALTMSVSVPIALPNDAEFNLTAVIEETGGTRSFWALAHPSKGLPDFHDPDCFVFELPRL